MQHLEHPDDHRDVGSSREPQNDVGGSAKRQGVIIAGAGCGIRADHRRLLVPVNGPAGALL